MTLTDKELSWRIQALRGYACFLVVAFHVIGHPNEDGLKISPPSPYIDFLDLFEPLRMPLFTFLSGYVYGMRPVCAGAIWEFVVKKARRLLVPLLVVSAVFFVVQGMVPGTNADVSWEKMWRIFVLPYAHFWFLQAIFLIFVAVALLDGKAWLASPKRLAMVLAIAVGLHVGVSTVPTLFSLNGAVRLAPFFFAGLMANRFKALFVSPGARFGATLFFVIAMTIYALIVFGAEVELQPKRTDLWVTMLSLTGCLTMLFWAPSFSSMRWVGGFSFAIYLYHVFFTAGARIALKMLGEFSLHTHFLAGLFAGVLGPIILSAIFRRSETGRRLLLGES